MFIAALAVLTITASARAGEKLVSAGVTEASLNAGLHKQLRCLRDTIYTEARGEDYQGKLLVAYVVLNRIEIDSKQWGSTPCEVAYKTHKNKKGRKVIQFNGPVEHPVTLNDNDPKLMEASQVAVRAYLKYEPIPEKFKGIIAYQRPWHAVAGAQGWFDTLDKVGMVGNHLFYRLPKNKERKSTLTLARM
jgi:spore germination cell wall hydrolase CwlJ-like protein